jgi:E3 ubiquitin-protein ligase RNF1/2
MMSAELVQAGKTWELSLYELHRMPQEVITDNTEIAVSPRSLHSELMCPICLDMLKNTMTTKECLHRFCQECIITALRSGNKECPTCRKKLISKRSLRPDPNFDMLISKIYPSREEYEAHQELVLAKLNKQQQNHGTSFEEGLRMQALNRAQKMKKLSTQDSFGDRADSPNYHGEDVGMGKKKMRNANDPDLVDNSTEDMEIDTDRSANSTPSVERSVTPRAANEIELIFAPLPAENPDHDASLTQKRFIKTTVNATVEHLVKYLSMRHKLDYPSNGDDGKDSSDESLFTLYLATGPGQFQPLKSNMALEQIITDKNARARPLELVYAYKLNVNDACFPEGP